MKEFFTKNVVDEYKNDPKIQKALNGCTLMNSDDFLTWFGQNIIRPDKPSRLATADSIYNMVIEEFTKIANSVCERKIDEDYSVKSMKNVLESPKFDILVILAPHWEKLKRDEFNTKPKLSIEKKGNHILGFVIVEKGECRRMPTAYSINLICTRTALKYKRYSYDRGSDRERTKGGILLGAYLYCAKVYGQSHGILELADGYTNISGFFAYSKQGFAKDLTLFGRDCFRDYSNLPMSVRLDKYSYNQIINHACGDKTLQLRTEEIHDTTGFIKLVPTSKIQTALQKEIALYCNLLYKMEFINDYRHHLDPDYDKKEIQILQNFENWFYEKNDEEPYFIDYINFLKAEMDEYVKDFKLSKYSTDTNHLSGTKRQRSASASRSSGKTMKRGRSH